MSENEMAERKAEVLVETGSTEAAGKADRKKVLDRATWFVYSAILIMVLGLLDQFHAKLFCLGNSGVTILRMVVFLTAISLVLTSIGLVIPSKRWRIYFGIVAFFVGFWAVMQPTYYVSMRTDVGQYRCIWKEKPDNKVSM